MRPLGDLVEAALSRVGLTEERVSRWLGRPCGCRERKDKLNRLWGWARRAMGGKDAPEEARRRLGQLTGEDDDVGETGNPPVQ